MTCDSPHHFAVEQTENLARIRSPRPVIVRVAHPRLLVSHHALKCRCPARRRRPRAGASGWQGLPDRVPARRLAAQDLGRGVSARPTGARIRRRPEHRRRISIHRRQSRSASAACRRTGAIEGRCHPGFVFPSGRGRQQSNQVSAYRLCERVRSGRARTRNMRAAKALRLNISPSLLARADEVINERRQ